MERKQSHPFILRSEVKGLSVAELARQKSRLEELSAEDIERVSGAGYNNRKSNSPTIYVGDFDQTKGKDFRND